MCPQMDKNVQKETSPNETWQKIKRYLYVVNVEMNPANGLENVQLVTVGILFMSKKL